MASGRLPVRPSVPRSPGSAFCAAATAPPQAEVSLSPATAPEVTSSARGGRRGRGPVARAAGVVDPGGDSGDGAILLMRQGRA